MKKIYSSLFIFLFATSFVFAQIETPVTYELSLNRISDTEGEVVLSIDIEKGWHVYSAYLDTGVTAQPTAGFWNDSAAEYTIVGGLLELEPHEDYDPIYEETLKWHEDKAVFRQKFLIHSSEDFSFQGEISFMACNDRMCLPPEYVDIDFKVKGAANPIKKEEVAIDYNDPNKVGEEDESADETASGDNDSSEEDRSLAMIFFLSFLGGFAALLTPCVFPMIPMTVSFFTKQSKTRSAGIRNALIYGIAIIVIYVLLGTLVVGIFGSDALSALSTNVIFNLVFFFLLIIFGLSFLGAFEIMLPNSWANKVDAQADKGGIIGIIFMALALAIVSFSCTGPIVGSILFQSASHGGLAPVIGMLGFSTAIALPFALFAAFPGWMNSLPKSGGWLNSVKVFLGFLEIAFAFKFLSNADLVLQLHLLEREAFIAIWIAVFGALTLYLFGKLKLPHDSPLPHISVGRLMLGLTVATFTIYLIPGLWGAPVKLISGFPPSEKYSESPYGVGTKPHDDVELPEHAHFGEHDIITFDDYDYALKYARKVKKPLLIDFTGHACVNCRKMEQQVWSSSRVLNILKNDVVLVSLYVDDKRPLPKDQQFMSELQEGKKIKYIGQKWSEFQAIRYKQNTQPLYVIVDADEKSMNKPTGYDPDISLYVNWLKEGIDKFNKK